MTPEIRKAALRIAAKTALVVTMGCSGGGSSAKATPPTNTGGTASAVVVACDAHLGGLAKIQKDQLAADDPLKARMDVYGEVFANVGERTAPRTQECCTEELVKHGTGSKFRWECCSALADVPQGAEPSACTPWGPPCPPEMPALA